MPFRDRAFDAEDSHGTDNYRWRSRNRHHLYAFSGLFSLACMETVTKRSPRVGTIGRPGAPHTGYPEPGTCVLRSSSRRRRLTDASVGRANESSGFDPPTAWPGHWVRQRGCCGSDRVADRPSALHAEAPDRHGWGTRLAPNCSSRREPSRIDERLSPCCVGVLPGFSARTRRNGVVETRGFNPSLHGAWSEYRNR